MTGNEPIGLINLFSGSRGNCTYIRAGADKLLVDAGGSAKAVERALADIGVTAGELTAILVTHEHGDHTHALPLLAKKYRIPVHMTRRSAEALGIAPGCPLTDCLVVHDGEFRLSLGGGAEVSAFLTPHDSVQCVGYRISLGGYSVGLATDLGYVTQRVYEMLYGCDAVMLESNHDREMVQNGRYTETLKRRILSNGGHLSNDDCAEIAAALARSGTHAFMLAHLSRENNTPEAALRTVSGSLRGYGVSVVVADQDRATALI